jgi:pimeloyl-ACP methyl ester carboxylesterase
MKTLKWNNIRLNYLEELSSPKDSPALLFIHSAGNNLHLWDECLQGLKDKFNLYALDLPGHGNSEGQAYDSIEAYSQVVIDFINHLELTSLYLVGHSMGSAIIQQIALINPDYVKGLILIGGGAKLKVNPAFLMALQSTVDKGTPLPDLTPFNYASKYDPKQIQKIEARFEPRDPRMLLKDLQACNVFNIMDKVSQIQQPILAITGEKDQMTPPKYALFYETAHSNSKVVTIGSGGHMVMVERPDLVTKEILHFCK